MKFLELLSMNDELSGQLHFMLEQVAKAVIDSLALESFLGVARRQHQAKKALVTELPVQIGGAAESQLHIFHVKGLRAEAVLGQPNMDVVSENAVLLRQRRPRRLVNTS